tara:strand:+ start:495 stop:1031 length:537 start_codon:yes stop_codon:yes gene_type:complete
MNNTKVFRKDEWLVDIYVHILLVLIVLSLAFWLFLSKVETKSLQGEVKNQIGKLIDNFTPSDTTKNALKLIDYDQLLKLYNGKPNKAIKEYNDSLLKFNIIVIITMIISFILVFIVLKINCGKDVPIGKIFLENIGLFILVGIIEVLFFWKIASRFIPVKPSFMMKAVKDNITDKANK